MIEVKRGMLKYYHRGLLSKKWKEYKFILYDSSLLTWYIDIKHTKPDGTVLLKDVERFICVGPYTRCLPNFPHLDNEYDQVALIAFPISVINRNRDIIWLLCEDIEDLNLWMKAIVQTLPSHAFEVKNNSPSIQAKDIQMDFQSTSVSLIGSRLQNYSINSKVRSLQNAGYNYGHTLWGRGEGWGYISPLTVPGFAGIGGSGCHANLIESIYNEDNEQRLKEVKERTDETTDNEEVVYILSKEKDDEDQIDNMEDDCLGSHDETDHEYDDGIFPEIRETLEMTNI